MNINDWKLCSLLFVYPNITMTNYHHPFEEVNYLLIIDNIEFIYSSVK